MKVIRKEDKNSNKYIINFTIERGKKVKYTNKDIFIKRSIEDYSELAVHMADGSKPRYDNVSENIKNALQIMWNQHNENLKELKRLTRIFTLSKGLTALLLSFAGIIGIVGGACFIFKIPFQQNILMNYLAATFLTSLISGTVFLRSSKKINELKKYEYLKNNETVLNQADLENSNILENVKNKDKAKIIRIKSEKDKENDKHYFDINSIDRLSLDALKKIKSNIERDNYLGLVITKEEVKEKSLIKK